MSPARFVAVRRLLLLLCLCALGNGWTVVEAMKAKWHGRDATEPAAFARRIEALKPLLSEGTVTGYTLDAEHSDTRGDAGARLYLTQYALSPRLIAGSTERTLVIVDADHADADAEIAARRGWTLVRDLGNGVRLYATTAKP